MAIDLVDGKTAFWFNGNWAWPNLEEAGAETGDEYGFLPYFMNDDPDDLQTRRSSVSLQAGNAGRPGGNRKGAGGSKGIPELDRLQRDRTADAGEDLQHHPAVPE